MKSRNLKKRDSQDQLVYAYCIIKNNEAIDTEPLPKSARTSMSKLGLARPYIISLHDISAIVSRVPKEKFSQAMIDRKTKDLDWLSKTATKHEELVEHVMKVTTPIPLKLCTIFKGDGRVLSMLKRNYAAFYSILDELSGKVEFGVSSYISLDAAKLAERSENRATKRMQRRFENASEGRAYFLKQELDEMLISEFASKAYSVSRSVYEELEYLAEHAVMNKPIATEIGTQKAGPKTDMIMNAAFLLRKDKVVDFERRFEELKKECESKGVSIKLTGPWPPYNFSQQGR
jgi:hypothetical protein